MSCPPLLVLQVLLPLVTVPVGKGLTPSFGLMVLTGDERGSGGTATSVLGARLFLLHFNTLYRPFFVQVREYTKKGRNPLDRKVTCTQQSPRESCRRAVCTLYTPNPT